MLPFAEPFQRLGNVPAANNSQGKIEAHPSIKTTASRPKGVSSVPFTCWRHCGIFQLSRDATGELNMPLARGQVFCLAMAACCSLAPASVRAQALGEDDLKKIASTYSENEMRFKRDFAGKHFAATLPFRSASENIIFKGQYLVGFGRGSFLPDLSCTVSSGADIDRISDWNKGDLISVSGQISDVTMGSVDLKPCMMTKAN